MILSTAHSVNGVPIRLTKERWEHIITSHLEIKPNNYKKVLNIVKNPDAILKGDFEELLAVRKRSSKNPWIVVVYKEISQEDGFVITAYLTTDSRWLFQREIIWSKE